MNAVFHDKPLIFIRAIFQRISSFIIGQGSAATYLDSWNRRPLLPGKLFISTFQNVDIYANCDFLQFDADAAAEMIIRKIKEHSGKIPGHVRESALEAGYPASTTESI